MWVVVAVWQCYIVNCYTGILYFTSLPDDVDTAVPAQESRAHHVQSVPQVSRRPQAGVPATQGKTGRSRSRSDCAVLFIAADFCPVFYKLHCLSVLVCHLHGRRACTIEGNLWCRIYSYRNAVDFLLMLAYQECDLRCLAFNSSRRYNKSNISFCCFFLRSW